MKNILAFLLLVLALSPLRSQQTDKIKIFIDCQTVCYETYLKQNLHEVEFVRDPKDADVYILITAQTNGSGGETYYIETEGQHRFEGINDKFSFNTNPDMQDEDIREKLLKYLKLSLARYWAHAGRDDIFDIRLQKPRGTTSPTEDKWNNWVFSLGISGWGNGDSNYSSFNYTTHFRIKQIKEKHKFRVSIYYSKGKQKYAYGDQIITADKERIALHGSEVFSINDHWSYGFFGGSSRSIYSNYRFSGYFKTGLEYNFFPYSQSSKHMLTLQWKIGPERYVYFEQTIFGKTDETLIQNNMALSADIVRKWGNVTASILYNQYLGHPSLRSFNFYTSLQLRLAKGLNFRVSGNYAIRHDQINIAAGGASLEEILLRQKELLSSYNFFVSAGLSYSFGSIYNTIVNPRFEGGSGHVFYVF